MGHPVKVYILNKLAKMGTFCYFENLVDELPICISTLSQHLKELKNAGFINGEIKPPFIKYCIDKKNWDKAKKLLNEFVNQYVKIYSNMVC